MSFETILIEVSEGDSGVQVCMRLGGMNWLVLERQLIFELDSVGGTYVIHNNIEYNLPSSLL